MVERYLRQSPLTHLGLAAQARREAAPGDGVLLSERPYRTVITLRGEASDAAFAEAVKQAAGWALPTAVGQVAGDPEDRQLLCLGPDEWWLTGPDEEADPLVQALEEATAGRFASVVETSDNWFALELAGPRARDLLAKACPLDLHPGAFGPGRCAQSLLAKAPMTLQQLDETPRFRLYLRRSFADYAWRWLSDAGCEYGVSVMV